jgi:hypothetical protein
MTVSIVGGLDRLEKDYIKAGKHLGIKTKVILKKQTHISDILENSDAIVLLTSNIAHGVASKARSISKQRNVPLFQLHNCSVKSVEGTIEKCIQLFENGSCTGDCINCEQYAKNA